MSQLDALLKLGLSEAEAKAVLEADKLIDKGEDLFPLNDDQKKAEKKMRQADRSVPTVYNFKKRERKPNEPKREIIQVLDEALTDLVDDVTVTNPERQIDFVYNGINYRVVLSAPRK